MTKDVPKKPFSLGQGKTSFTLRDLDNVAPRPAPPQNIRIDHPRLAPPGMSGIKPSIRPVLMPSLPKIPRQKIEPGLQGEAKRAFKSLVQSMPGKGHERDR